MRPTEAGRSVVVRRDAGSSPVDVTPEGFNVRTKVHEYAGGSYCVHDQTVFFANFVDQRLYRQDAGAEPQAITPDTGGRHRYADGRALAGGSLVVCVRERHEGRRATEIVNELVVLAADGASEARTIAGGRDSTPFRDRRPTDVALRGSAGPPRHAVGRMRGLGRGSRFRRVVVGNADDRGWPRRVDLSTGVEPDGELHFVSDRTGWWNLYRARAGDIEPLYSADAEFGWPLWQLGASSYAFLANGRIACIYGRDGAQHVALLDPGSGELLDLDLPHTAIGWPALSADGSHVTFIGGAPSIPNQVVSLDSSSRAVDVLRESRAIDFDPGHISVPRPIEFPTEGGLTAHALFYPPTSPAFTGPPDELPPLVVATHGGPTGESPAVFDLRKQYFTSRGFAVVDVNYGGSTGHGRAYRRRLNGQWGIVDTADCINAAKHLASGGPVDGSRMAVRGGSAGGYTALCALTFHEVFRAGPACSGSPTSRRSRGLPYAYLLFEGEQHGFRRGENILRSHEAELSFFAQIFGIRLGIRSKPSRSTTSPETGDGEPANRLPAPKRGRDLSANPILFPVREGSVAGG
ncbi:MAG TPA: prolyl oligopeptidase family serine peptidase [Actinomycetota bacterium]|nr:prolyl oligopeptidase family serine peptidase [Actinomycetota bacterium]